MKTEQVFEITIAKLKENETITAQEMMYKHKIPAVQFYSCVNNLVKLSAVKMNEYEGKKTWTLVDADKLPVVAEKVTPKNESVVKKQDTAGKEEIKPLKGQTKTKRDLTRYKFMDEEFNKSRLALRIVKEYIKLKKPSLKQLLLFFPNDIVPPYGMIATLAEAKKMSKGRPRFFLKDEDLLKIKDGTIAVSNQFTSDRIARVLLKVKKELKFSIK